MKRMLFPVAALLAARRLRFDGHHVVLRSDDGQAGGTLTVPWSGDVDSIDPGITYYSGGYMVAGVTQRTPMAYEPGRAQARPDLATTAPTVSDDGKTVTVKLRSGVHFSPPVKREVIAADVKYAIERGFFKTVNNPYAPAYFGDVVGAEPGAEAGTRDRRDHDAGRAHGRLQALPPDRRHARRGARAAARRARPARLRAAAGPREGLRLRRQAGGDRPVHGRLLRVRARRSSSSATRAGTPRPTSAPPTWTRSRCRRATTTPR